MGKLFDDDAIWEPIERQRDQLDECNIELHDYYINFPDRILDATNGVKLDLPVIQPLPDRPEYRMTPEDHAEALAQEVERVALNERKYVAVTYKGLTHEHFKDMTEAEILAFVESVEAEQATAIQGSIACNQKKQDKECKDLVNTLQRQHNIEEAEESDPILPETKPTSGLAKLFSWACFIVLGIFLLRANI
ncbi:hypothetical protein L4C36_23220 [Photobacterium japonica]|uniref:hypothetical protein n=1 Tax=Photobacterium japonica TaxID=2910235 RepID=UPI003D1154D4